MAKYASPVEVFNAALLVCAENPISENDDSAEAQLYRGVYDAAVRAELRRHKWSFAKKTAKLVKQGPTGVRPAFAYVAPNDLMLLHKVELDGLMVDDVELSGGKILTNVDSPDLYAHYSHRVDESLWPEDFTKALVTHLEGLIRRSLHNDLAEGKACLDEAERLFIDAMARDRQSQAAPAHTPNPPLVGAWRGRRRRA